jgi:shikimate kinase
MYKDFLPTLLVFHVTNIVLVGVPGAGKSTVGKLLAAKLNRSFYDSDHEIETRLGKSVSDIFTQDGEAKFREVEADVIAELLAQEDVVVSLGGGSLLNDATRGLVKKHDVVWLMVNLAGAVSRVGLNRNRPLLLGNVRGQLADLMQAREPLYREVALHKVDTSEMSASEVVAAIITLVNEDEHDNN